MIPENNKELHIDLIEESEYLKAADFHDKVVTLTIKSMEVQVFEGRKGDENKLVLAFSETDKKLVMCKTNNCAFSIIISKKKAVDWKGEKITVGPHLIPVGDNPNTECIRVIHPKSKMVYHISRAGRKWTQRRWDVK